MASLSLISVASPDSSGKPQQVKQSALRGKLLEGDEYMAAEDFEKAANAYAEAIASTDRAISEDAQKKLHGALLKQKSGWIIEHWKLSALVALAACALCLYSYDRLYRANAATCSWAVTMHTPWSRELPTDIFLCEFELAVGEIALLRSSIAEPLCTEQVAKPGFDPELILYSQSVEDPMKEVKIEIKGVNIGWLRKLYLQLQGFFTWGLHIHIANTGGIHAYAVLQKRERTVRVWHVPNAADPSTADVRDVARSLAYEVMSEGWVRK